MELLFEALIDGLMTDQFGMVEGFANPELGNGLRKDLLQRWDEGRMHAAGVGKNFTFQRNTKVRGDVISWLDTKDATTAETAYMGLMDDFMAHLNRTCYTGLTDHECHYAMYEAGNFYKRHKDQFHQDHGRQYSIVTYLNENWKEEDGGQLVVYGETGAVKILPLQGRAVFFKSDQVEHEVLLANKQRLSIAGWLRKKNGI